MNSTFDLKITTPFEEKEVGDVYSIVIDTDLGEIEVLPNHTDFIGGITSGTVSIKVGNKEDKYHSGSGFIVYDNKENIAKLVVNQLLSSEKLETMNNEEVLDKIDALLKKGDSLDSFSIKYLENQKIALSDEKELGN